MTPRACAAERPSLPEPGSDTSPPRRAAFPGSGAHSWALLRGWRAWDIASWMRGDPALEAAFARGAARRAAAAALGLWRPCAGLPTPPREVRSLIRRAAAAAVAAQEAARAASVALGAPPTPSADSTPHRGAADAT